MPNFEITRRQRVVGALGEASVVVVGTWVLAVLALLLGSNRSVLIAVQCVTWVLAAYGLYVSFAFTGQMTVAVITTWGVSSFTCLLVANEWGWGFELLLPVGMIAGAVAGLVFGLPILRTTGHYFIVVTFAVAEVAILAGQNWDLIDNNRAGVFLLERPSLFGWELSSDSRLLIVAAGAMSIAVIVIALVKRSRLGERFAAVRENEQLAQTLGCPVKAYKLVSLVLGGAIAGMAGPLIVSLQRHAQLSEYSIAGGITLVVILILGGKALLIGPLVGGAFWFFGPEFIGADPLVGQAIFGLLLAVVVIVSPKGIASALTVAVSWLWRRGVGGDGASEETVDDPETTQSYSTSVNGGIVAEPRS